MIKTEIAKLILQHEDKLGVKPIIIGIFWNNQDELIKMLKKSIANKEKYDEFELLTPAQKREFLMGELFF